jgi:hypothetical protein
MKNLVTSLEQKQIYTVLRQNSEGKLYGITFVDNQNKAVFNGSDLSKGYSAGALQSRLGSVNENSLTKEETNSGGSSDFLQKDVSLQKQQDKTIIPTIKSEGLLDMLLSTKEQYDNAPPSLLKKKRKKKKKNRDF